MLFFRLNYAIDCRYGVLWDIAAKVLAGSPIDVTTGYVNVIWQGDANAMALRSLCHCARPAACPQRHRTGDACRCVGSPRNSARRFGARRVFVGVEAPTAWLSNAGRAFELMGRPKVSLAQMIDWVADWVARDMPSLNKPTGFEVRNGTY